MNHNDLSQGDTDIASDFDRKLRNITNDVTLPFGWQHRVTIEAGFRFIYQVTDPDGTCNVTGKPMPWNGRKHVLSRHMTRSEIVQTILKASLTAIEHEARERFLYHNVPIFDPHYDVIKLLELRVSDDALDVREDA